MNKLTIVREETRGALHKYWLMGLTDNQEYLFKECTEQEAYAEVESSKLGKN